MAETKRQFSHRKLKEWSDILQLGHWTVGLRFYKALKEENQYCWWSKAEASAIVGLNPSIQSFEELEQTLAHELSHLIHSPENRVFDNIVETYISDKKARKEVMDAFNLAQNEAIEQYLRILYNLLRKEYPPHTEVERPSTET